MAIKDKSIAQEGKEIKPKDNYESLKNLAHNLLLYTYIKQINIKYYYIYIKVAFKNIKLFYISINKMIANNLIKLLIDIKFHRFVE